MKTGGALARLRRLRSHLGGAARGSSAEPAAEPAAAIEEPADEFACPDWDLAVPMTDEQRFFFDLRGWLLLPAVLSPQECAELKAEVVEQGERNCFNPSGKLPS